MVDTMLSKVFGTLSAVTLGRLILQRTLECRVHAVGAGSPRQ
jgi:hypothetical protein